MASMAFDTLQYARRLRAAGFPEPQADVQAELMAEAFGFYAENLLTRDHFTGVLNARFGEFGALMDARFSKLEDRMGALEGRIEHMEGCIQQLTKLTVRIERTQFVHTWILGVGVAALVVPQLNVWLA
ncbi:hypothetical protein CWI75_17970 [Kineobactrum sediminis]|uniref:DUF1640 domain-containing protein n=1 Tax=Kineobactrum sediminis TaxID=1905677 RepID=A0A2N5XXW0_9GAMM|nr:hypothetical protein [Kineobactrum sediminis]PLW80981.1 hypothetical protein CWI75_17970 [Kineobactrum sediminis]